MELRCFIDTPRLGVRRERRVEGTSPRRPLYRVALVAPVEPDDHRSRTRNRSRGWHGARRLDTARQGCRRSWRATPRRSPDRWSRRRLRRPARRPCASRPSGRRRSRPSVSSGARGRRPGRIASRRSRVSGSLLQQGKRSSPRCSATINKSRPAKIVKKASAKINKRVAKKIDKPVAKKIDKPVVKKIDRARKTVDKTAATVERPMPNPLAGRSGRDPAARRRSARR